MDESYRQVAAALEDRRHLGVGLLRLHTDACGVVVAERVDPAEFYLMPDDEPEGHDSR